MSNVALEDTSDTREAHAPRRSLLIESAAIFFSVLFAFFVEQWREEYTEREQADAAIALVKAELVENLAELERVVPGRQALLDGYINAMQQLKDTGQYPTSMPTLEKPNITRIAYDLATDSGAVTQVPAADLLVMARAYEVLSTVKNNDVFLNNRNAQVRFNDAEQYISGFIYYTNLTLGNEPLAIERVEEAIRLFETLD